MVTGNGPLFTPWDFKMLYNARNIRLTKTPAYHPQGNEIAERFVQEVQELRRKNSDQSRLEYYN